MRRRDFLATTGLAVGGLVIPGLALGSTPELGPVTGRLVVRNQHTGEREEIDYADAAGRLQRDARLKLKRLWRDWRTGEQHPVDSRLPAVLDAIAADVGRAGDEIVLLSGYRSPATNRKVGGAKRSRHMTGQAADIRIPGVSLRRLRDAAVGLQAGGVGYYPASGFIHVDTSTVRYWRV